MKLIHKLLIPVLVLSVIPLLIVGYQALTGLNSEIKDDIHTIFKEKVSANSTAVLRFMKSNSKKILEAVHFRQLGNMNKAEVKEFINDLLKQYEELMIISVLDEIGEEIASAIVETDVSPILLQKHLDNIAPNQLEKIISEKGSYSDIFFSKETPMITLYSTYVMKNRPAPGRIAITISLSAIKTMIEEIQFSKSANGVIVLLDKNGALICSKSKFEKEEELTTFSQNPYIKNAFNNKKGIDSSAGEFTDSNEILYMGAYKFIESFGWLLLVSEPKEDVFASAELLKSRTIGVILLTIVISLFSGYIMAKKIIKPVLALVKGAEELGAGNLDYRIERTTSDEIGTLTDSFSDMGMNLKHREETIAQIRTIAAELNSLFEREAVANRGILAIKEITHCVNVNIYLYEGETFTTLFENTPTLESNFSERLLGSDKSLLELGDNNSTLLVPLGKHDPKEGWIFKGGLVITKSSFTPLDQQVAEILSGAISVSLMNIEFLSSSIANERRQHELELAELVQKTLYPENDPETDKMDFGSYLLSSSETGGDWFGYLESEDKRYLSVLIGDVTGHGAPAALVTAATNAFVRTVDHLSKTFSDDQYKFDFDLHDPLFLLKLLNKIILDTAHGRLVMTFFISTIDMENGNMIYANAGHNIPWVLRKDPERDTTVEETVQKVKKVGGKLKIKIGKKKDSTENSETQTDVVDTQDSSSPTKKKIKIKMGKKKVESDTAQEKIVLKDNINDNQIEPTEEQPKRKIKIKMGKKKDDSTDTPTEEKPESNEEAPAKKGKLKIKIGSKSKNTEEESGSKKKISIKGKKKGPNRWENVNARGMRLGELPDATFECRKTRLLKGDMMVWYTDGWIENTNPQLEEFGKRRMQRVLQENEDAEPLDIIEALRVKSWDFYEGFPREDDITIVISKIKADW